MVHNYTILRKAKFPLKFLEILKKLDSKSQIFHNEFRATIEADSRNLSLK